MTSGYLDQINRIHPPFPVRFLPGLIHMRSPVLGRSMTTLYPLMLKFLYVYVL